MTEDAVQKYYKFIRPEMYDVLKQNYGIVKMFHISGISINKVSIIVYDIMAPTRVINDESKLSLQSIRKIGDKMILPVDKDCIDNVIRSYGDVVACLFVRDGIIIGILTFEELNVATVEQANNFIVSMTKKK